jgi:hypothetical protein
LISSAALSVTFNSTVGVATADIFLLSPQKFGPAEANPYINIIINPCLAESQIVSTSSQYYSDERRSLNYAYIFQVSFGEQFAGLELFTSGMPSLSEKGVAERTAPGRGTLSGAVA